ncbi:MAG: peptide-methionine (S)-S-oxide reductase MsrA [Acidobacteriota bacterium]
MTGTSRDQDGSRQKATFAAGCFWGVEAAFRRIDGIVATKVGFMGGSTLNPTYREVCTGTTGHAEVVQVDFDPDRVSYERLLELFWSCHDPTTPDRQGPDIGTQYRSAVFFHTPEQEAAATAMMRKLDASGRFDAPIVTAIVPAGPFYEAEEYHQRYLERRGMLDCVVPPGRDAT